MASNVVTALNGLHTQLIAQSSLGPLEEYFLGATQSLAVSQIRRAIAELGKTAAYSTGHPLIALIVDLTQQGGIALADEIAEIATDMQRLGVDLQLPPNPQCKPLAAFAREPALRHTVFVDESGSGAWEEDSQPVLVLVGVLVEDKRIPLFDRGLQPLFSEYGLDPATEVHAHPFLSNDGVLKNLEPADRFLFLRRFIEVGLNHIVGFHYLGMLKPLVKRRFRREAAALGLDAYTAQVVYFNLTLQAACFSRIGVNRYRYLFDRTDTYGRDIRAIIRALQEDQNDGLRLHGVAGEPQSVDSTDHRFVQLADVAGYFLNRHRQIEIKTFQPKPGVVKHREQVLDVYALLRPKLLDFVEAGLVIDWTAIRKWMHPKRRIAKGGAVKLQRKEIDGVADYFDRMADFLDMIEELVAGLEAGRQPTPTEVVRLRQIVESTNAITDQVAQFLRSK